MRENVALVTDIARDPMPVDDAVAQVGLAERAIVKRPEVLLCDEPSVDATARKQALGEIDADVQNGHERPPPSE